MAYAELFNWVGFTAIAFVSAFGALLLVAAIDLRGRANRRSILTQSDDTTVFLFDGDGMIDATPQARHFLSAAPPGENEWRRLLSLLTPRFPGIDAALDTLPDVGILIRAAADGTTNLRAELRGNLVRLTLVDPDASGEAADIDIQSLEAMRRELETLRAIADESHFLMWRQDAKGRVTWVNRAYLNKAERVLGAQSVETWPPPPLFDLSLQAVANPENARRITLKSSGLEQTEWYEVHATPVENEALVTAVSANATVLAEEQLREFMQTLTKTFAHLTIGLAVFDRARRLALFNPSLTDLTGLPVDFLTLRPTLFGFLDKLRERHMIPEPKDYKSWRRRIVELEAAAADGTYAETWSLPNGQTYRVTGRPHPNGAVALLIEDISAEISLTRRFRAELELGQSALDCVEDAMAVFSPSGVLVLSNDAYGELWGDDPGTTIADIGVVQATRTWMKRTAPTPVWGDFRDFVGQTHDRTEWSADVCLKDGRQMFCRFAPISGGATLARFRIDHDVVAVVEPVSQPA